VPRVAGPCKKIEGQKEGTVVEELSSIPTAHPGREERAQERLEAKGKLTVEEEKKSWKKEKSVHKESARP